MPVNVFFFIINATMHIRVSDTCIYCMCLFEDIYIFLFAFIAQLRCTITAFCLYPLTTSSSMHTHATLLPEQVRTWVRVAFTFTQITLQFYHNWAHSFHINSFSCNPCFVSNVNCQCEICFSWWSNKQIKLPPLVEWVLLCQWSSQCFTVSLYLLSKHGHSERRH